ncbi:MAG TPA: cytochrome B6 [Actinobacteria bacterium]|nr:cytochrome B6 [Actinomycetota bacterium]HCK79312.1 cytochrome B6 [Actinomycetota bacterium]
MSQTSEDRSQTRGNWTAALGEAAERNLPFSKLLPGTQPAYVASWIYVFGVLTLVCLALIIATGVVLTIFGPSWWHTSLAGHYINSLHFWSVQLFFLFMVVHLWGKFWMAAWRGGRARTWITGGLAFVVSIIAGLTGYLLQTNLDSQWIAFEAKDGLNATGVGAVFNVANLGQILMFHVFLLPAVIAAVVLGHVLWVRLRGVVPPIDAAAIEAARSEGASR